jgi:uncharacterized protein DUF1045
MTLTGPVSVEQQPAMAALLDGRFNAVPRRLAIDSLALFVEDEPGANFRVHAERRLDAGGTPPPIRL